MGLFTRLTRVGLLLEEEFVNHADAAATRKGRA